MYPIDLHTHTVASTHAYSTLHDYVAAAKQKGIKLFAITHCCHVHQYDEIVQPTGSTFHKMFTIWHVSA